jgi:LysM repeat protein
MKGRDQKDIRRIEKLYRSGNSKVFQGAIRALDTDLRDQVKDIFDALGMVKKGVIESVDLAEAKKLGSRVKITKGRFAGKEGIIRQMDNGRFKGADKSFDIDLDNGKEANGVPGKDIKIVKESVDLDEGKMKEFHDMVKKGMSAEQISKKIGIDVKAIKDFMKDMD